MLRFAAIAFVVTVSAIANNANAQESVAYDPETGAITFVALDNAGALELGGPGVPAGDDPAGLGGLAEVNGDIITWAFLLGAQNGDLEAGNLFPTGLMQSVLESDYRAGVVISGSGDPSFRSIPFTGGLPIPEPASIMLAGLGLIGFVGTRRRS